MKHHHVQSRAVDEHLDEIIFQCSGVPSAYQQHDRWPASDRRSGRIVSVKQGHPQRLRHRGAHQLLAQPVLGEMFPGRVLESYAHTIIVTHLCDTTKTSTVQTGYCLDFEMDNHLERTAMEYEFLEKLSL